MTVNLDIRTICSPAATELYISAVPKANIHPADTAAEIFSSISQTLHDKKACILQERIFATESAIQILSDARSKAYGDIDDGVAPSFLVCEQGLTGPIAGVQVHAVACDVPTEVISVNQTPCGRILRLPGCTYLTLSAVSAPSISDRSEQVRKMLEAGEAALKQFDNDFLSVARTWMWLSDILSWYNDFNHVRNQFFTERGILGPNSRQSMPASTGIGLAPADGSSCSMDLVATLEPTNSTKYVQAVGKQQCAFEYGSAFSRAAQAITPAAETVFVSGTASIDASGASTNIGDALSQINATIENVRAVLKDMHCTDDDVVQVVAYCKTTNVEREFNRVKDSLSWPWVSAICDVCRCDLLFEIEAAATPVPPKKSVLLNL